MLLDSRLNEIENPELEKDGMNNLLKASEFLIKISSPKYGSIIRNRLSHIKLVSMENDDKIACRRINGDVREFSSLENAFVTAGNITTKNGTTHIDNYIYLRKKSNQHQKRHEGMHGLTAINEADKIDENIYAYKTGMARSYYKTSNGNLLETEPYYEDGDYLNEGLTDYTAFLSEDKSVEGSIYMQNVLLAMFLTGADIGPDNNLIQAFTSDTVKDIDSFENDFDSYSEGNIKYKDIANFKARNDNSHQYLELLKASIRYRIKSSKSPEMIKSQIDFYTSIIDEMNKNERMKFTLWTIFEDNLELIIAGLKEEIEQQRKTIIPESTLNPKEDGNQDLIEAFIGKFTGENTGSNPYNYGAVDTSVVAENIDEYIIPECQEACKKFWALNIDTFMCSNYDDFRYYVLVGDLSDENLQIFKDKIESDERYYWDEYRHQYGIESKDVTELNGLVDVFKMQDVKKYMDSSEFLHSYRCKGSERYTLKDTGIIVIEPNPELVNATFEEALKAEGAEELYIEPEDRVYQNDYYLQGHKRYLRYRLLNALKNVNPIPEDNLTEQEKKK